MGPNPSHPKVSSQIRVVALLVIGGTTMLGRDGQATPRLGRGAGDESEDEARPGAAWSCAPALRRGRFSVQHSPGVVVRPGMVRVGVLGEDDELARIVGPVAQRVKVERAPERFRRGRGLNTGESPGTGPYTGTAPGITRSTHRDRSFAMLGVTHHWGRSRTGRWVMRNKTAKDRFRQAATGMGQWYREKSEPEPNHPRGPGLLICTSAEQISRSATSTHRPKR